MTLLRDLCRHDTEALDRLDRVTQHPVGINQHTKQQGVDNINSQRLTGTSSAAALRRLRKDAPALHAQVLAGEVSPHGAMVQAGFRKKTVTVPLDVARAAAVLRKHFTPDEIEALKSLLLQEKEV